MGNFILVWFTTAHFGYNCMCHNLLSSSGGMIWSKTKQNIPLTLSTMAPSKTSEPPKLSVLCADFDDAQKAILLLKSALFGISLMHLCPMCSAGKEDGRAHAWEFAQQKQQQPLILKPKGQAGHSELKGGYNLRTEMGLHNNKAKYNTLVAST